MIAAYLLPYPVRGIRAPYLWIFYKMLADLNEPVWFWLSKDYLADPAVFVAEHRWEVAEHTQKHYGYGIPDQDRLTRHQYDFLPAGLFEKWLTECQGNPIAVFRRLLRERIPELEQFFEDALSGCGSTLSRIEAILTWHNCPSLSAVAEHYGITVIHLEVGPLRAPLYRPTAYCDFSGVNGNTEAERRYRCQPSGTGLAINLRQLQKFFLARGFSCFEKGDRVGVALQVEDDSNLVAYGNGYDNQAALIYARLHFGQKVLIRGHPGSLFQVSGSAGEVDSSPDSVSFIGRCRHVVTINSSVGLEAILLGRSATVLGQASYRFLLGVQDEAERMNRLAFFLFAYLIPESLRFDVAYLRFRLSRPSEADIVARHLRVYRGDDLDILEDGRSMWELIALALKWGEEG